MHTLLDMDEVSGPAFVSTGHLPPAERVDTLLGGHMSGSSRSMRERLQTISRLWPGRLAISLPCASSRPTALSMPPGIPIMSSRSRASPSRLSLP